MGVGVEAELVSHMNMSESSAGTWLLQRPDSFRRLRIKRDLLPRTDGEKRRAPHQSGARAAELATYSGRVGGDPRA